ncbi:peptidase [Lactobacillus helveticus]|nr:peptidase [Lactobacillus helveticus]MZR06606.1 peptidase [Lactobacillus helveticus]NAS34651.1 peptidase [Lactobacillus helveticus]PTS33952.1 peptidase [Lactobacillus helveticus]PTS34267.1 peptidase [Lactobacillus helveticus]
MNAMTMRIWNKVLSIELIIGMVISIGVGIIVENIPQLYWSRVCWITLAVLAIIFALQIWGKNNHTVKHVSQWLSNLTLILIFNFLIYTAVSTINLTNKSLVLVSSIVGLLLFLVVDIPVVVVNFPVVKNWFMRLFMVFLLYVNDIYNVNRFLGTTNEVKLILHSGVVDAIACFILTFFIARAWNFRFSWNLKLIKTKYFQLWLLC